MPFLIETGSMCLSWHKQRTAAWQIIVNGLRTGMEAWLALPSVHILKPSALTSLDVDAMGASLTEHGIFSQVLRRHRH